MKSRLSTRATLVAIIASGSIPSAHAANRYWDTSNANTLISGSDAFFQTAGDNTVSVAAGGVPATSVTQTTNSTATTINSGGGRSANFQQGSLKLVVIPEPNAAALIASFDHIGLLRRRRN
jgi:hypothetical protein